MYQGICNKQINYSSLPWELLQKWKQNLAYLGLVKYYIVHILLTYYKLLLRKNDKKKITSIESGILIQTDKLSYSIWPITCFVTKNIIKLYSYHFYFKGIDHGFNKYYNLIILKTSIPNDKLKIKLNLVRKRMKHLNEIKTYVWITTKITCSLARALLQNRKEFDYV